MRATACLFYLYLLAAGAAAPPPDKLAAAPRSSRRYGQQGEFRAVLSLATLCSIGGSLTPARHHPPAAAGGSEERRPAAVTAATAASAIATAATTVAVATAAPFASSWDAAARGASRLRATVAGTETSTRPPSTSPKIYRGRQRTHTPLRLKLTIGALPFAWKAVCDGVAAR